MLASTFTLGASSASTLILLAEAFAAAIYEQNQTRSWGGGFESLVLNALFSQWSEQRAGFVNNNDLGLGNERIVTEARAQVQCRAGKRGRWARAGGKGARVCEVEVVPKPTYLQHKIMNWRLGSLHPRRLL